MRILLLTQWFEPEPTFKGLLFARELAARGHDVEVLTGFPNYPGGNVYPGYKIRPWRRERIDGIRVLRVALYPSHDKSAFRRVPNYMSFAISAAVIGTALVKKPDVVYVYNPPATIGFPAVALGLLRRVPFVFDICDLWPDTIAATGMLSNPWALALLGKWCNFIYRRARHIVVISPGFKQQLVHRGVPPDKIDVIYNWCDVESIRPNRAAPAVRLGSDDEFKIMFAGTMGIAQALDAVLEAVRICVTAAPNARFFFMGGGVERGRLESKAAGMGLANVRFLPRQPISAMGAILAAADLLLVHLKDDPLFRITIPSKTQAYLAAGKPILMGVQGDAADLIERSGAGMVCTPENPESLAAAVAQLANLGAGRLAEMGRAGWEFYDRELSLSAGVDRFEAVFRSVINGGVSVHARGWYPRFGKRLLDVTAAIVGGVLLSPVLIAAALLVKLTSRGPWLFRQRRLGRGGASFLLYKFRTMTHQARAPREVLDGDPEVTAIGRWLRRFKIDELPQIWSVVKGEMSIVGPRPGLPDQVHDLDRFGVRRLELRPGLTGLAQIHGNIFLSWPERWIYDADYADRVSLRLDIIIILRTVAIVLRGERGFLKRPSMSSMSAR